MMIWRFRRLLDAYGADPARWPTDERAAAEDLLRRSAAARAALTDARELDSRLQWEQPALADPALADRIIARTLAHPQELTTSPRPHEVGERVRVRGTYFRLGLWPQLAGLAAAGLLGFVLGAADLGPSSSDDSIDLSDVIDLNSDLEDPLS